MKKNNIIGALTVIPPLYIIFFISFAFYLIQNIPNDQWGNYIFPYVIIAHLMVMLINIVLLIVLIRHIILNSHLSDFKKVIWGGSILITMTLTMPIYWFIHMRNDSISDMM